MAEELLTQEIWLVADFGGPVAHKTIYFSNHGRIKRVKNKTGKSAIIQGSIDNRGRKIINVRLENGKYTSRYLHHLIAEGFLEKPSNEHHRILHLDHDTLNNHVDNLKWATDDQWRAHVQMRKVLGHKA